MLAMRRMSNPHRRVELQRAGRRSSFSGLPNMERRFLAELVDEDEHVFDFETAR